MIRIYWKNFEGNQVKCLQLKMEKFSDLLKYDL